MKRLLIPLSILFVLAVVPALGQEKSSTATEKYDRAVSPGELTQTENMWFYRQYERQYLDPKMAVRRKAEFRSAERQRRIETRAWLGVSKSRPTVIGDPLHRYWMPHWASYHYFYPACWQGVGRPWIVLQPPGYGTLTY